MADMTNLVRFVESLKPGERNKGLFWAACRAAEDGLDPAPLIDAAAETGVNRAEAVHTTVSAAQFIAKARRDHEKVNPS